MLRSISLLLLLGLAALATLAPSPTTALTLPQAISSNMVLQRAPQRARVWGTAQANAIVTLTLDSAQYKTFADDGGEWSFDFPAQQASVDRTLSIAGDGQTVKLSNVAFGDVYICSGQSNMEFAVSDSFTANESIADSIHYPLLRLFGIQKKASLSELNDTTNRWGDGQQWVVSQPKYVGGPSFDYFSATCYYFGRSLYKAINGGEDKTPIGLIDTCWGGTRVEAWTTQEGLDSCGPVASTAEYYASLAPSDTPSPSSHRARYSRPSPTPRSIADVDPRYAPTNVGADPDANTPRVLYNGMIAPIKQMRFAGATWYQGEQNSGNATNYACRFPAMINDWREQLQNYHLNFYFVLLAAYKSGGYPAWPLIREAQLAALSLPYVGVASAQDLGDETGPAGAIHPRNKTYVGERLALNAQHDIYGQDVVYTGPMAADVVWPLDGAGVQTVIVRFRSDAAYNRGLQLLDTSGCTACCRGTNGSAITVGTSNGRRLRADVTVDAATYTVLASVDLSSEPGVSVTSVAHNWEQYPECALYNAAKIPHLPVNLTRA